MSLKYRIAVVILLLEAVVMSFILTTTVNRSQEINRQQFEIKENIILNLLSELSRFALFSHEFQELQPYIENISQDPQVLKILILNHDNLTMTSSDLADAGLIQNNFTTTENTYWRSLEVKNEAGVLGKVAINFSNVALKNAKKDILFTGIRIALIGMSIIAISGFISGYLLTRRLDSLSRAAQRVKEGDLSVKSNLSGRDEIALLGQAFDEMTTSFKETIDNLGYRENQLRIAQNELERRVDERTSELTMANEELEHLATHDPLTNLPNRSLFLIRLHQAMANASQDQSNFATLMMDLDRFKEVNDTLGHDVGDDLLIQVSQRISGLLRKTDTIARLGGDEFSVILTGIDQEQAKIISNKISQRLAETFEVKSHYVSIGASIGIAMFPEHGNDASKLMKLSDTAMYTAKRNHLNYLLFDETSNHFETNKNTLDKHLRAAIDNNELVLHYQPKVDFTSGKLVGVEALVRWQKDDRLIYPDEFIPYAEKTGLIKVLTQWVINAALKQLSIWNEVGKDIKMSVNLSMKDLEDPTLSEQIIKYINHWQVEPNRLILEITETSVMSDPNRTLEILNKLDQMDIGISIDDFGTGYSSLMYIKKLPVDEIKIDRSFVMDILSDPDSLVIVRSIIDLAHNLGIQVTAEGVENLEIWETLSRLGCDLSQGYYSGRPMSQEVFDNSMFSILHLKQSV